MHVLLFDIDGTLLSSGGAGQAAMEDALRTEFGVTARTEGIAYAGRTDRAITSDMALFHELSTDDETHQRFLAAYLSHLPNRLAERAGLVLPGVRELLDALSERSDTVLGLLTGNFGRGAQTKLEHFELHHHFEFGGFGDVHHDRDDVAREALAAAEEHLNGTSDATRTWVVGDTPADVRCGRAIGARVVAVATGIIDATELEAAEPDHLFEDFSDPSAMLELLDG